MAYRFGTANFSKGEIGPELIARFDVDAYVSSVRLARNVMVRKYGGLTKRPGTRLVAEVYDDSEPLRIIPFQFSLEQTYALELGHGYMRVCATGGVVLNEELAITAITNSTNAQITAAYHGYSVDQQVYLTGIDGDLGLYLNGRIARVVAVVDADNFTIDINTTGQAAFTSATGGITRTGAPDPDPTPPVVPPPADPYVPPNTGGGGLFCVTTDTLILMADGTEREAGALVAGDMLRTRHERSFAWGDYPVEAVAFSMEPVFTASIHGVALRGTAGHRVWDDGWVRLGDIGEQDGEAMVAKITVAAAHTYVSNGILSHNAKAEEPF